MKKIYSSFLFLMIAFSVFSQTPSFWNFNVAAGANAFPFGTTTSRKVQWRINANSLGAVTAGNNITTVYFMTGNTSSNLYPLINIRLKQGVTQFAGGGNYETGMTLVYSGTNITKTGTTGGWIQFILQTPFLYDPNQVLLVEVEHNATSGTGPTVYQSSPAGPGSGRQYGNYPNPTYTGTDATVVHFGIDVIPNTPCNTPPASNTIVPLNYTTCPMLSNPTLSLATTYTFGGIQYQWLSSTISGVGPFTPIPGSTLATAPTPTVGVNTWFQCVATCTNPGGGSTSLTPCSFFVSGSVVSTVPYTEDFEGLQSNDRLPNCSWLGTAMGAGLNSWTTAQSGNRSARSGTKFGTFTAPTTNNHVYTNGITMQPGITYSAAIWYSTEYFGYSNWTNLSLLVGSSQSATGLVQIASVSPAISGPYKLLSGIFTVPSSGDYYIAIRANGAAGSATYLNFDDLTVTIPCDGLGAVNAPTVISSASSNTICQGDPVTINATGANSYLWSDGSTGSSWNNSPMASTLITVVGTNVLTNCTSLSSQFILVNTSPVVFVVASQPSVCPGQTSYLSAQGANNYAWSTGGNGSAIPVNPTSSTTYSVVGTAANGCATTATISVAVKSQPTVVILPTQESCAGEMVSFTANGAGSYNWYSSSNPAIFQGTTINVQLFTNTTFTAIGTGANGCTGLSTISHAVSPCTGIQKNTQGKQLNVYPNPSGGIFNLELSTGKIKSVVITDLSGRTVMTVNGTENAMQLDLSKLASGVYYVTVAEDNITHFVRLIKE